MQPSQDAMSQSAFRSAMETRDLPAIVESFAPTAAFHSPFTAGFVFEGRERIGPLIAIILEVFADLRYTAESLDEHGGFLLARATIDGIEVEIVDHLTFDVDGKISEFTVFMRPLPGAAAAMRAIGARLGRRRGPLMSLTMAVMATPLALMTRIGDRIAVPLIASTL